MSIRKILKYGTPSLRVPSKEVLKISKKIQVLIDDLIDTMYAANGVGIAAPQVGENLRIFIIDVTPTDKPPNPIVFVNPKIIKKSGAMNSNESCLSFPEAFANVRRYEQVTVKALDSKGRPFVIESKDDRLLAKALQHEFDHLNGVLFIDHARNRFEVESELLKAKLPPLNPEKLLNEPELEQLIQEKEAGS